MGLARLVCCGRPQANKATSTCPQPGKDAKDIPGVIRPGAGSASVGGKTLLVTAQSGTAQDFHNYLHNSLELTFVNSPGRIALQPHISETVTQLENTGAAPAEVEDLPRRNADVAASRHDTCYETTTVQNHIHGFECDFAAFLNSGVLISRAYSCPVGEMQRPPSSLLEASLRRRQRARAPVAQRAAEGSEAMETFRTPRSLQNPDASQLQTIERFMTAYLATLDGEDMECKFAMTPLLHEAVILRAHDGKHYHGKAAVLRRMQQGRADTAHADG